MTRRIKFGWFRLAIPHLAYYPKLAILLIQGKFPYNVFKWQTKTILDRTGTWHK